MFAILFRGDLTKMSFNEWDRMTGRDNLHSNCERSPAHLKMAGRGFLREKNNATHSQVH